MGVSTNSDDPHICLQTAKRAPVTARMPARSAEKAVSESNFQEDHLPRLHEISCRESVRIKRHSGALRHQIPLRMPPELSFHSLAPRLASLPTRLRWEVPISDRILCADHGVTYHEMNRPIPKRNLVWAPGSFAAVALKNRPNHLPTMFSLSSNANLVPRWNVERSKARHST